jgi:catechol 2,3-dioxygenase-like lactoylglutathione lyase family enzyme
MTTGVRALFHPVHVVSSMDAALAFYRDTLGMRVTFDAEHDPASIGTLLGYQRPRVHAMVVACPDGGEIELARFGSHDAADPNSRWHEPGIRFLSLHVAGIEALVSRVERSGYAFTSPIVAQPLPDGDVAKVAVCRGPDGVGITFTELPGGRRHLDSDANPS